MDLRAGKAERTTGEDNVGGLCLEHQRKKKLTVRRDWGGDRGERNANNRGEAVVGHPL